MKNEKKYFFIFIITLFCLRYTCYSGDSSTQTLTHTLTIVNNFGVPVVVEIWTGSNPFYDQGNVKADNSTTPTKEQTVVSVSNVAPDNTFDFSPSEGSLDILVIFGTDQGSDGYIYVTDNVVSDFSGTATMRLASNGDITVE